MMIHPTFIQFSTNCQDMTAYMVRSDSAAMASSSRPGSGNGWPSSFLLERNLMTCNTLPLTGLSRAERYVSVIHLVCLANRQHSFKMRNLHIVFFVLHSVTTCVY